MKDELFLTTLIWQLLAIVDNEASPCMHIYITSSSGEILFHQVFFIGNAVNGRCFLLDCLMDNVIMCLNNLAFKY